MQAIKWIKICPPLFFRLTGCYFALVACPLFGQALQKKALTESDYKLWGNLDNKKISDSGNWVSYSMNYEATDTLFVKNIRSSKIFAYPKSYDGEFGGDSWFASKHGDTLSLQNLHSGQVTYMPRTNRFAFSVKGNYLLLFYRETDGNESLVVKDFSGQIVAGASDISEWKWNSDRSSLAYTVSIANTKSVGILFLGEKVIKKSVTSASSGSFKNLVWQEKYLAFMGENTSKGILYLYNSTSAKLQTFIPDKCVQFPKDMTISPTYGSITISSNGSRVAFGLEELKVKEPVDEIVQIWHTTDRQLYPSIKRYGDFTMNYKVGVWFPESDRFIQLTDKKEYTVALGPKGNYALTYDPMAYEPYSDANSPRDIYATNLISGKKELVLQKISGNYETVELSPEGKYVSYVFENNWWIYDFEKGTKINVTAALGVPIYDVDFDRAGEIPMYGVAGWLPDDKALLVYDQYDIWEISVDGKRYKRLTKGREANTTFRIDKTALVKNAMLDGITTVGATIDKMHKLLLHAQNDETGFSGYYSYHSKTGLRQLVWRFGKTNELIKASAADSFTYVSQRFDSPPALMYFGNDKITGVYQSNKQHNRFKWGHAERITYTANDKMLSGILFFPADYDKSRKYPMIVSIYEQQGSIWHQYINPTLFNEGGINISNLSSQGYFILFPDIAYTMGDVGVSAVACVNAACDMVLSKYNVDLKKIGLTGHSFGGYETYLIIAKTNRFAAAFVGSGSADLVSSYLTVGGNTKPNIFRFEHQQYRVGRSLFEDRDRYFRNSPILLADSVQTPLLAWVGELDENVSPLQSKEFYLALRRLGKEETLLVYPGEGHSLIDKVKQADLTLRFEAWFKKYLKP